MKKLTFILLFFGLSIMGFSQTYPIHINNGSYLGDPSAASVYSLFGVCNANFTDIYGSVISGPVNGTKYTDLRKGVKRILIDPIMASYFYYVKTLINGVYAAGHYHYKLEIAAASTSPSTAGTVLGFYDHYSDTALTMTYRIGFAPKISPGGISGNIIIDFSKLTLGTTYTCSNFIQGGIFAIAGGSLSGMIGGDTTLTGNDSIMYPLLPRINGSIDTINGSSSIYLLSSANHMIRLDSMHKILQGFKIIMSDSAAVGGAVTRTIIKPLAGAKINNRDSIYFGAGHWVDIYPDGSKFQAISDTTLNYLTP